MTQATQATWKVTGKNGIKHTVTARPPGGTPSEHLVYYCTCPWHVYGLAHATGEPCQHVRKAMK